MRHMSLARIRSLFGQRVRQIRGELGWSQDLLAEKAEINPRYLSRIELGQALPSIFVASQLASALGVPITELLRDDKGTDVQERVRRLLEPLGSHEQDRALRVLIELFR
jgi:XRE family aerobic/anaerobic benzoate catabolism transcriptional regulator